MEWIPSNSGRWDQSSTERVRGRAMSSTATEARNLDHPAGQEHLADAV